MKKTSFILFFILILPMSMPRQVHAQGSNTLSLSVSPPLSEIIIQPGKTITQAFTVKNEGQVDLEIVPRVVPFTPDKDTGDPVILIEAEDFPYAELQNLDRQLGKPFPLPAGQSQQLVVKISMPKDASEREYYETLLLSARANAQTTLIQGVQTEASAKIGVHLLISVSKLGEDRGVLEIFSFKAPKIIDVFSPLAMTLFVKNTGSSYTKAHGEIKIQSLTGKVVKVFPILQENVLAQSVRKLHGSIPDPDDPKSATSTEFIYDPNFMFGPYTINVTLKSATQPDADTRNYSVIALPISPFLVFLAIFGARRVFRYMKKRNTDSTY